MYGFWNFGCSTDEVKKRTMTRPSVEAIGDVEIEMRWKPRSLYKDDIFGLGIVVDNIKPEAGVSTVVNHFLLICCSFFRLSGKIFTSKTRRDKRSNGSNSEHEKDTLGNRFLARSKKANPDKKRFNFKSNYLKWGIKISNYPYN